MCNIGYLHSFFSHHLLNFPLNGGVEVYFNYPKPHITVHRILICNEIMKHRKNNQRFVLIDKNNVQIELQKFWNNVYRFAANSLLNDLWVYVNISDRNLLCQTLAEICCALASHYGPFNVIPTFHC